MRRAFPAAFAALAAALGLAGALLLFTTFRTYDDEGYVLFSLANFARAGGLYTQVYSQYGPFFFLAADAAHRLFGFDFTHTAARVITLVHWLGAALLCGHLVWRHTRSAAWSLFALAATFGHLWQMTSEPMHPGGFIVFVVALAAWCGTRFISRAQPRALAVTCGLLGAALVLTKINVGALLIVGAGAWLLLHTSGPRLARPAVLLAAAVRGTPPAELLEGVLLAPLRHPGVYSFGVRWRPGAAAFAVASLALCVVAVRSRAHPRLAPALAALRLGFAAVAATAWLGWLPLNPLALMMSYGLSCAWLFVLPLASDETAHRAARLRAWLALLALTQALHAYPVGGSQIGWGTFLFAPLLALGAADAVAVLRDKFARWIAPTALAVAGGIAFALLRVGSSQWRDSEPLGLPGAEALRLEPALATELRVLSVNATAHCDLLFSLPGMFSFNLWTGLPSPTAANVTHWFNLLSPAQQSAVIAQLAAHPRAGLIVERDVLGLITGAGIPVGGPLRDYLYAAFAPAFAAGSHEFWVRRDRSVAPLGTAGVRYRSAPGTAERVRLELCVTAAGRHVTQIDWLESGRVRATFTAANARAALEPLRIDGTSTAAAAPGWNVPLPPLARLVLLTDDPAALAPPQRAALFRLRDATGAVVGEAILRD
jgi:hypothetical protein